MANATVSCPYVVFALEREMMGFRRRFPLRRPIAAAPCRAWLTDSAAKEILVLETGMGHTAMSVALSWALGGPEIRSARYSPAFVLLAGFSGALRTGQGAGDPVLARRVVDEHGGCWSTTWPETAPAGLCCGTIVTADAFVTEPAAKRELGILHDALAVDMESSVAAALCGANDVPFGCLRAISDEADRPLSPMLTDLLRDGRPRLSAVCAAVFRRPSLVGELLSLARNTRRAARSLGFELGRLLAGDRSSG